MKPLVPVYDGEEPAVFVCYAREDAGDVYPEIARLAAGGVRIWYDAGIEPASDWSDSIARRIEHCSALLYFATPASANSRFCRSEIAYAQEHGKRIVTVVLQATELPGGLRILLGNEQMLVRTAHGAADFEAKLERALLDPQGPAPATSPVVARPRRRAVAIWALTSVAVVLMAAALGWTRSNDAAAARAGMPGPPSEDRSTRVVTGADLGPGELRALGSRSWTGQEIDVDFRATPLKEALEFIADASRMNLVAEEAIDGQVDLVLDDVPWDEVLTLLASMHGLAIHTSRSTIYVALEREGIPVGEPLP